MPLTFTWNTFSKSASLVVVALPICEIPAQLTSISNPFNFSNAIVTAASWVTSKVSASALFPFAVISSTVPFALSVFKSTTITCAPCLANTLQTSFPIPLPPPVTMAILLFS